MANHYTMFSEELMISGGKKAVDWITEYLDQFDGEMYDTDHPMRSEQEEIAELYDIEDGGFYLDFDWKIEENPGRKSKLWIYAEESGNPDHVAHFLQQYLKRFDPNGSFGFMWSSWCDKPRVGAFEGGALFVTSTQIKWHSGSEWLSQKNAELQNKRKKTA